MCRPFLVLFLSNRIILPIDDYYSNQYGYAMLSNSTDFSAICWCHVFCMVYAFRTLFIFSIFLIEAILSNPNLVKHETELADIDALAILLMLCNFAYIPP